MDKFSVWFKANLKLILAVFIPLALLGIIFALPLKLTAIPVTESYWTTEMRTENYTTTETFTDMEPYITSETRTDTVYNQAVGYGSWSKSFQVDRPGATVSIEVSNSYGNVVGYYSPRYYIYSDNYSPYGGYSPYPPAYTGSYWGNPWDGGFGGWGGYGSGQAWATVRVTYPEQVTKYRPVSKTRDVVKTREVPVQVRKERTVMQNVRMSVWESLFR
jgi:hypothetical protein